MKIILVSLTLLVGSNVLGQNLKMMNAYPEIGAACPYFNLKDVQYYYKNEAALSDFKGKWLILDFWNRWCQACENSFPKTDSLQKMFFGKVQFLLVGYTGTQYVQRSDDKEIREIYEKNRAKFDLKIPIAYDSLLFHRFDIGPCPYIIIIDPDGIVRGTTFTLSAVNITEFLAGKQPELPVAHRSHEKKL